MPHRALQYGISDISRPFAVRSNRISISSIGSAQNAWCKLVQNATRSCHKLWEEQKTERLLS